MKTNDFLHQLDEPRVVAEITAAEAATSGEIRIFVSARASVDPVAEAIGHFESLGMTQTKYRNGVLLYFAPLSQKFAIIGDQGIHEKCGPSFWQELTGEIRPLLHEGRFADAVLHAVQQAGRRLAAHFPPESGDRDELPNTIARD